MDGSAPGTARAGSSELAAFAQVYRSTCAVVRGTLARLGVQEAALDDATQDVYVVAHRHRDRFDPTRPLVPWLVGIARRIAFRYRRANARGQRALAELTWATRAESGAPRLEDRLFLESFVERLSEERRRVFVLGDLYGMTGPEIARRLEIPVDTAYTRLRACRLELERALLAASRDDPAPEPGVLRRGWLVLLPRLASAPKSGGWLLAASAKGKALIGVVVVGAAATLAALIPPPQDRPEVAADAPIEAPARAAARGETRPGPAPTPELPPAPPSSRFEAMLAGTPPTRPLAAQEVPPADRLGAGLMAAAVAALSEGDAASALAQVERHAREFPDSALEQTRAITRIRALCRLGRVREARGDAALLRMRDAAVAGEVLRGTCAESE